MFFLYSFPFHDTISAGVGAVSPSGPTGRSSGAEVGAVSTSERFARQFYMSWPWIKCARAYKQSKGGLCERCLRDGIVTAGVIVHHKIHITPENITRPEIVLNFDNLELVCRDCHAKEHGAREKRYKIDSAGNVIAL